MPAGRPSDFNEEIESRILDEISSGKSLRKICMQDGFPDRVTVIRWQERWPEFATKCARAREIQGDAYGDMISDRLDSIADAEDAQVAKVQIAGWQWMASKLKPKVYGDKIQQEVTGKDGAPFTVVVSSVLDRDK